LDTGALIAADRGDGGFWAFWKASLDLEKRVPAPVVAQAWRGARNARMARVIDACFVIPLEEELAHRVGELCGRAGTSDVVDATVALVASRFGDDIVTGDPKDIRHLLDVLGSSSAVRDLRTV
jgi:hypothetical protein